MNIFNAVMRFIGLFCCVMGILFVVGWMASVDKSMLIDGLLNTALGIAVCNGADIRDLQEKVK